MTVSPTLGIAPFNPGPLENFAAIQSQQLQQFGQQLRQDVTTIQGNEQLKNMAQQLQGVNPGLVPQTDQNGNVLKDNANNPILGPDPNFASQMTQAISANPLGAHTPAGISIISQLGAAHQGALQQALWNERIGGQMGVAGIRAQASEDVANARNQKPTVVYGQNHQPVGVATGTTLTPFDQSDLPLPAPGKPVIMKSGNDLWDVTDPDNAHLVVKGSPGQVIKQDTKTGDFIDFTPGSSSYGKPVYSPDIQAAPKPEGAVQNKARSQADAAANDETSARATYLSNLQTKGFITNNGQAQDPDMVVKPPEAFSKEGGFGPFKSTSKASDDPEVTKAYNDWKSKYTVSKQKADAYQATLPKAVSAPATPQAGPLSNFASLATSGNSPSGLSSIKPKPLDVATAKQFLKAAGGDQAQAQKLAQAAGFSW